MTDLDITRTARTHDVWDHRIGDFRRITSDVQIRATATIDPLRPLTVSVQFRPGLNRWGVKLASGEWRSMSAEEMDAIVMLREVIREHQEGLES